MVLWALLQCLMLVPIVVLVCIVATPGTFPIRAHGSMGSTPVSRICAYSCPGLCCSRTRNPPHQGTWFYGPLLQCLMLVPIVVLVCIVATPGTFPIRAHGSMGSTPVSHASMLVPIVVLVCIVAAPGIFPIRAHVLWALLQCLMLVPIVVLVCIVATPGTFPIRAHGSMGSTPVSHACAYSCPGLYCSRTRNLPHQGTWFYEFYSSVSCLCL